MGLGGRGEKGYREGEEVHESTNSIIIGMYYSYMLGSLYYLTG